MSNFLYSFEFLLKSPNERVDIKKEVLSHVIFHSKSKLNVEIKQKT